ncbi:MAG: hypothetical protein H3C36_08005 [Chitinophagaceae bacterium]|nr:hypothetical protein [Chitinophagaceae bacterium]MCW5915057.1 hypothetical protein [Chitinophagaceae bacterium]MCZ2396672.1 hypothetical protein [Chitinophagales bacterium]
MCSYFVMPSLKSLLIEAGFLHQYHATLYNAYGKKALEFKNTKRLDIRSLAPGNYYLLIHPLGNTKNIQKKIQVVILR